MTNPELNHFSKEELIQLIEIYAKNWLATDGVWFQAVEQTYGMEAAIQMDEAAWEKFTVIEAAKIKAFLKLPHRAGIEGLKRALQLRFYANINRDEIQIAGNTLIYRTLDCRVQNARRRKAMPLHPCKSVGIIEYSGFAKTIDDRFNCEALSCYPDIQDKSCICAWRFTLNEME